MQMSIQQAPTARHYNTGPSPQYKKKSGCTKWRSRPGEGAGGGHISRPARGYGEGGGGGGALDTPPSGSGAESQKPTLFARVVKSSKTT